MWCPKCKTEYRDGITVCADCGTELVEQSQTEEVDICEINDEKIANELVEFLHYSGVKEVRMEQEEENGSYRLIVPKVEEAAADKVVHGYLLAKEEEREENGDDAAETAEEASDTVAEEELSEQVVQEELKDTDDTEVLTEAEETEEEEENLLMAEEVDEDTMDLLYTSDKKEYVKKAELYRDTKFSGITLLVFGMIGAIYLILSRTEVIPIRYNIVVFWIIAALFACFIIAGIASIAKSQKIKLEIPEEESMTKSIKEWLEENVTKEMVESWRDQNVSEMENDLVVTAHIRSKLLNEYPDLQKEYIEMLADEYFEEHFLQEDES